MGLERRLAAAPLARTRRLIALQAAGGRVGARACVPARCRRGGAGRAARGDSGLGGARSDGAGALVLGAGLGGAVTTLRHARGAIVARAVCALGGADIGGGGGWTASLRFRRRRSSGARGASPRARGLCAEADAGRHVGRAAVGWVVAEATDLARPPEGVAPREVAFCLAAGQCGAADKPRAAANRCGRGWGWLAHGPLRTGRGARAIGDRRGGASVAAGPRRDAGRRPADLFFGLPAGDRRPALAVVGPGIANQLTCGAVRPCRLTRGALLSARVALGIDVGRSGTQEHSGHQAETHGSGGGGDHYDDPTSSLSPPRRLVGAAIVVAATEIFRQCSMRKERDLRADHPRSQ